MSEQLKPCPFCGSEPRLRSYRTYSDEKHCIIEKFYVFCDECQVEVPYLGYADKNVAITAWNRRASGWNKVKVRPITPAEKEAYPEWEYIIDGNLPDDGQRILVHCVYNTHEPVQLDEYYNDCGMSYLDSGYELGEEVDACMPLPEPPEVRS